MRFVKSEFLHRPNFIVVAEDQKKKDTVSVGLQFEPTARAGARSGRTGGFWRVKYKENINAAVLHP